MLVSLKTMLMDVNYTESKMFPQKPELRKLSSLTIARLVVLQLFSICQGYLQWLCPLVSIAAEVCFS